MASRDDTAMGGPLRRFPTTIWTHVAEAARQSEPRARETLERLLRAYWKPVFVYIRLSWQKSVEDAKDLTQAFFAHILETNLLGRATPERGSFRGYLKAAITNFMIDAERAAASRRSGKPVFSIEYAATELDGLVPASAQETPDRAYDRTWFNGLFQDALAAMGDQLEREGKRAYLEVFRAYCLNADGAPAPGYRELAERFGVKETDVHNYLTHTRRLLKALLRERIREYAATEDELDQELKLALSI